ncbi:MAG: hypothetical protein KC983_01390 [Phycisphaerales bacterium]|nr:hypothetical protein [Phycisphaerales bacterium]
MNALTDGLHTADRRAWRRDARRFLTASTKLRAMLIGSREVDGDVEALVAELVRLSERVNPSL